MAILKYCNLAIYENYSSNNPVLKNEYLIGFVVNNLFFCSDYFIAMYKEKRNILLTIFLFFQIGFVKIASLYPELVERYYTGGIYPFISKSLRYVFGWIPFSIGDLFYAVTIVFLLRIVFKFVFKKRHRKSSFFQLTAILSVLYGLFYLLWGLNYSRVPVIKKLSLKNENYDIVKLESLTDQIVLKLDSLHAQLSEHDSLSVKVPYSKAEILKRSTYGYKKLSQRFSDFKYQNHSVKKSIFSLPLTYMGFSGYLNPFTGEAQVDHLIPDLNLLFTSSHEIAHQLGIASESEANFVGFLASIHHDDPYFQYAGFLLAFRYALFDLYRFDPEKYAHYLDQPKPGILKNMKESDDFWKEYQNPLEPVF